MRTGELFLKYCNRRVRMCMLMRQSVGEGGRWMRGGYYFNKNYREGVGKCIGILWSDF